GRTEHGLAVRVVSRYRRRLEIVGQASGRQGPPCNPCFRLGAGGIGGRIGRRSPPTRASSRWSWSPARRRASATPWRVALLPPETTPFSGLARPRRPQRRPAAPAPSTP